MECIGGITPKLSDWVVVAKRMTANTVVVKARTITNVQITTTTVFLEGVRTTGITEFAKDKKK